MVFGPFSKSTNEDEDRLAKRADQGSARADRSFQDRNITENRENTDTLRAEDRRAMLRDVNTVLPQAPDLPGYHTCWLTTTNNKDTLENRFRLGYSLVKPDELPGFCMATQKDSATAYDRIQVQEMVLAKIPNDLWRGDVIDLHHTEPNQRAKQLVDSVKIERDGKGRQIGYTGGEYQSGAADGYADLSRAPKAPTLYGIR